MFKNVLPSHFLQFNYKDCTDNLGLVRQTLSCSFTFATLSLLFVYVDYHIQCIFVTVEHSRVEIGYYEVTQVNI